MELVLIPPPRWHWGKGGKGKWRTRSALVHAAKRMSRSAGCGRQIQKKPSTFFGASRFRLACLPSCFPCLVWFFSDQHPMQESRTKLTLAWNLLSRSLAWHGMAVLGWSNMISQVFAVQVFWEGLSWFSLRCLGNLFFLILAHCHFCASESVLHFLFSCLSFAFHGPSFLRF